MMKRNILEPFLSQPVFFETSKKPNTAIYCIIVKNSGPLEWNILHISCKNG